MDQVTQVAEMDPRPVGQLVRAVGVAPALTLCFDADGHGAVGLELMESIDLVELGACGSRLWARMYISMALLSDAVVDGARKIP